MKLSEFSKNYVFTTKVEIDDSNFVVLRELNQRELLELTKASKKDYDEQLKKMASFFAGCVIESTFENENGPASGKEIEDALKESGTLYTDILNTWYSAIPFNSRLKMKEK